MSEPLDRDTLFKRLRSKPENKASQGARRQTRPDADGGGDRLALSVSPRAWCPLSLSLSLSFAHAPSSPQPRLPHDPIHTTQ